MAYDIGSLLVVTDVDGDSSVVEPIAGVTATDLALTVSKSQNTGWALWTGTDYTQSSPLDSTTAAAKILNNANTSDLTQAPANNPTLFNTASQMIEPFEEGCFLAVRINFTAESDNSIDEFDIYVSIPTIGVIARQTFTTPKANNNTYAFSPIFALYASQAMVDNGAEFYVDASAYGSEAHIWGVTFVITQIYSPS